MNVTTSVESLVKALETVSGVIQKTPSSPILANAELTVEGGNARLRCSNLSLEMSTVLRVKHAEDGKMFIPAEEVQGILSRYAPWETVTLNSNVVSSKKQENTYEVLALAVGKFETKFTLYCISDFPREDLAPPPPVKVTFNLTGLNKLIDRVAFAVPEEDGSYAPCILLLDADGERLRVYATDGYRIAIAEAPAKNGHLMLLDGHALPLLKGLVGPTVQLSESSTCYFFRAGNTLLVSHKKPQATFPNYRKILARFANTVLSLTVKADDLRASVNRAAALVINREPWITFSYRGGDELSVSYTRGKDADCQVTDSIAVLKQQEGTADFKLNAQYMMDFLAKTDEGEVSISYTGPNKPVLFTNGVYRYVISPRQPD